MTPAGCKMVVHAAYKRNWVAEEIGFRPRPSNLGDNSGLTCERNDYTSYSLVKKYIFPAITIRTNNCIHLYLCCNGKSHITHTNDFIPHMHLGIHFPLHLHYVCYNNIITSTQLYLLFTYS